MRVNIGLVTTLSGIHEKNGIGYYDSLKFAIARRTEELELGGIEVEVQAYDDYGEGRSAVKAFQKCVEDNCQVVIGPWSSGSMNAVLEEYGGQEIPIIATMATASYLGKLKYKNFFRFTNSDSAKAELLLRKMYEMYPQKKVWVFVSAGPEDSFGVSLGEDVQKILKNWGINYEKLSFGDELKDNIIVDADSPVVICAVSRDAVRLLSALREKWWRNQAFSFGSNTNWLARSAVNTIVVCDLDRQETDVRTREYLDNFEETFPASRDPNLPTMSAGKVLVEILHRYKEIIIKGDSNVRRIITDSLKNDKHESLFGPMTFDQSGELIGHENLSILRVVRRWGRYNFIPLKRREKPMRYDENYTAQAIVGTIAFVSAVLSILGVLVGL
jgi:ABC-type branched-subunit amino acid transport system substrate-binding protein